MYLDKLFNLKDKVAAVIGAGGHLCSEMAKSFARVGCKVVIIDLRLHKAPPAASAGGTRRSTASAAAAKAAASASPSSPKPWR